VSFSLGALRIAAARGGRIVEEFKAASWPFQRLGVRADIGRFLHEYPDDLLEAFERTFSPGVTVASSDEQARAWLRKVDGALSE
jgi:hypothetical protein